MICSNCGSNNNPGDSFCRACGSKIDINNQISNNYRVNSTDQNLIDAYIDNNVDKIKNGTFSFCTFFLGAFYTFYRKMWLLSFVWIMINFTIMVFLPSFESLFRFIINIIISIKFKTWYLAQVTENVEKIKNENMGKSNSELANICKMRGGTTLIPVFLLLGLILLLASMQ